mgnify:CR=1 FL=1
MGYGDHDMSMHTDLVQQSEPCASCAAEGERLAIRLRTIKDDVERADEYCLSCACALATGIDQLLREAPQS